MFFDQVEVVPSAVETEDWHLFAPIDDCLAAPFWEQVDVLGHELGSHLSADVGPHCSSSAMNCWIDTFLPMFVSYIRSGVALFVLVRYKVIEDPVRVAFCLCLQGGFVSFTLPFFNDVVAHRLQCLHLLCCQGKRLILRTPVGHNSAMVL